MHSLWECSWLQWLCMDDDELLGENMNTIKKNTGALLVLSKEVGVEVSFEKMK